MSNQSNCTYVYLSLGHKSFTTGKIAIVKVSRENAFLTTYLQQAKEKVCEQLGLQPDEVIVFDWRVLGSDVLFV